jgi:UDP-3-O-[3-hydroxymyristoyl] N-acetylglucosamine deacetylase/3-hydroxyacyl-[acyl-carrier-protein] dehydratase
MEEMNTKQRTIRSEISISGIGLHTGRSVTLIIKPAPENHWFKFRRIDLEGQPLVTVDADNVSDTSRGTTISENGASVSTIEHFHIEKLYVSFCIGIHETCVSL